MPAPCFILWESRNGSELLGVMLVLTAAIGWTVCNVIIRETKPNDIVSFIVWTSVFVPIPIVCARLTYQYMSTGMIVWGEIIQMSTVQGWLAILYQAYISSILGYKVWIYSISKVGLSNVVPYSLLIPVSGLFFGWLIYDEILTQIEIVNTLIILIGLSVLSASRFYKTIYNKLKG